MAPGTQTVLELDITSDLAVYKKTWEDISLLESILPKEPFFETFQQHSSWLAQPKMDQKTSFLFSEVDYNVKVDCNRTRQNPNAFNFTYSLLRSVQI